MLEVTRAAIKTGLRGTADGVEVYLSLWTFFQGKTLKTLSLLG